MTKEMNGLMDALEKGDVVELQEAIVAAEDSLHLSPHARQSSSTLSRLIAKAKDAYLIHMNACRPYVKPLRRACSELNERSIFAAVLKARDAPADVQLFMYTDICKAESLRSDLIAAQQAAVAVMDSQSSSDVDRFLTEYSPLLEDRTLLALVQRREDLRRMEGSTAQKQQQQPRGHRGDTRSEWAAASASKSNEWSELQQSSGGRQGSTAATFSVPYTSSVNFNYADSRRRVVEDTQTPWVRALHAMQLHAEIGVQREEEQSRCEAVLQEEVHRIRLYQLEMRHRAVQLTGGMSLGLDYMSENGGREKLSSDEDDGPVPVSPQHCPSSTPRPPNIMRRDQPLKQSPVMHSGAAEQHTLMAMKTPSFQTAEVQLYSDSQAAVLEYGNGGRGIDGGIGVKLHPPAASMQHFDGDTPNISPIKENSVAGRAVSFSDADPLLSNRVEQAPEVSQRFRDAGERRELSIAQKSGDTVSTEVLSAAMQQKRLQARLRAVLQEEDIHRRDIEGTQDFDCNVFLYPVLARISMLRRAEAQRLHLRGQ